MDNTNKQKVIEAIWENPGALFGGQWKPGRDSWEYLQGGEWKQRGAVRLKRSATGAGIRVFFNHGSGRAGETPDVFDYVAERDNTGSFWETLRVIADVYKIELQLTEQERATIKRGELARDAAASLIDALRKNPNGATGRYITQTRGLRLDGVHFGELTADSLHALRDSLKQRGKSYDAADLEALGLTPQRARAGYNCVIPYYRNGIVQGFVYRNISANPSGPKYLYSEGLSRGGYCDRLAAKTPAVIVEGQLDAVRLIQQGVNNVIAMGGAKLGADIAQLLRGRGISEVVYIPDAETDERGERKTAIVCDAIKAFQAAEADGEPVIKSLLLLDLPAPQEPNGKTDADSYGKSHTFPQMLEFEPVAAWSWEIERLREQAARIGREIQRAAFVQEQITDIYTRNRSPFVREQIRQYVGRYEDLARYGVTPEALGDIDELKRGREYQNRIKAAADDLAKAVQDGANPETVGPIVRRLVEAEGSNTRAEWAAQLSETFEQELQTIAEQPDTLKTRWELGRLYKAKNATEYETVEPVEFFPADISVFCAATSHGKTAILFQAAADLVKTYPNKTFLFVSCEENKRQLLERALNVCINIGTGNADEYATGGNVFIKGTRKRTLKAIIKGAPAPNKYNAGTLEGSGLFDAFTARVQAEIKLYGETVRPRLDFVHTEASTESICSNVLDYVERRRAQGVEVGAVFVDYVQLLTTEARNFSRHDELKGICKALKDCAARTELPVILAAQLNRDVLKQAGGLDNITVANIGEGADVERIAHDIYLVWQSDKTPLQWYAPDKATAEAGPGVEVPLDAGKIRRGLRSRRLFSFGRPGTAEPPQLKHGYLYVEQLKARDGVTGGWGLFPFDGERGTVGEIDAAKMKD